MGKKFDTDHDPEDLKIEAEYAEYVRRVIKDHASGNPVIEPNCYEPDKNGKCQCSYCRVPKKK